MSLQVTCYAAIIFLQIRRPLGTLFELLLPVVAVLILIGLRFAHCYITPPPPPLARWLLILSTSADSVASLKIKACAS